ncbi:hypothetical protein SEVIR_4G297500v4 [Setaria viridis]|uniref:Uncharacterized protein n=1 Tax=Setaria viridis TaxID=4556 RepID=A0A4U6V5Q3_SETVI|nr:uncharacterized protein LOC117853824 isoform X1 [Setaria viridis]TKW23525.1 hypothetical protein SEVIR_4G297500v2 [Setaria viridis]
MAPSFGRSISFPLSPARSSKPRAAAAAYHVRSISLPCRSHPLLAHLQTHTAAARAWALNPTAASPSSGLAHIDALHAALTELLLLPETQAAVRAASSDRLLDAFLLLADAHRGFHEVLLTLRSDAADVRAALRRRDAARLASAVRSQRRNEKELARLAATVSSIALNSKCARLGFAGATAEETEMAAALMDAAAASAAASAAVFSAAASVSAAASSSKKTATFVAFTKKADTADVEPEKLEELEQCIDECESGSEMVFRSIVRTRVSLLNIRTPAI